MSKRLLKLNYAKPIRMWIDGKCYNLKQYNQDKYKKLVKGNKKEACDKVLPVPVQFTAKASIDLKVCSEEAAVTNDDNAKLTTKVTVSTSQEKNQTLIIPVQFENQTTTSSNQDDIINKSTSTTDVIVPTHECEKFVSSFEVPKTYYQKLQNFYGLDYLQIISSETKTDFTAPTYGKHGKLSVFGANEKSVTEAITEIHSVIGKIREQSVPLQFIGVPCLSDEVKLNFEKFKTEILNGEKIDGMHESIFQSPHKLHVTVNVLSLMDEREKSEAINALQEYKNNILDKLIEQSGPLKIHVCGIDCMQENFKKVDVLYAKVKIVEETDETNFQKIVNDLSHYFYERGLLKRYEESVKLHMTLINTKYRSAPKGAKRPRWAKRQSFDARSIMEKYKEYDFGFCPFDSIHLSLISSKGKDGYYQPISIIKLNKN